MSLSRRGRRGVGAMGLSQIALTVCRIRQA